MWPWRPRAPLPPEAKAWVEARLAWLCRRFPANVFSSRPLITPDDDFFPRRFDGSHEATAALFDGVCRGMLVPRDQVDLVFYRLDQGEGALGLVTEEGHARGHAAGTTQELGDGRYRVRIGLGCTDPVVMVGTMAHELAHVRLGRLRDRYRPGFDNELTTDLLTLVSGFGLFVSAGARPLLALAGTWPDTGRLRPEYMTAPMFAYALAHLAWFENERKPAWREHLVHDVAVGLLAAVKYLFTTSDTKFTRAVCDALPDEDLVGLERY